MYIGLLRCCFLLEGQRPMPIFGVRCVMGAVCNRLDRGLEFEREQTMSESKSTESTGTLSPYLCHCLVSRQIARHVSRIYDRHLAPTGISAGDLAILEFLANERSIAIPELAAMMFLERTTLLRNLKPLIDAGYLETARDQVQKRRHTVSLTKAGEQKRVEAHSFWLAAQEAFEQETGEHNARDLRSRALQALGVLQDRN